MAYKRISPQPVVEGGTGASSLTAYAVVCGGTTSTGAVQSIASVGTSGQILTSNGVGALPTFQAVPASSITITGDTGGGLTGNSFTFTGGTTGLSFGGVGSTETLSGTLAIANGGTNATSMANTYGVNYYDGTRIVTTAVGSAGQILTSNGAGVAPTFQPASGVTGPGSSTDRAIATWNGTGGSALFNNSTVKIDSSGRMTNTTQPAFLAYLSNNVTSVTGDGTVYTIAFDSTLFNRGNNFDTGTATFTAPVTGIYLLGATIYTYNIGSQTGSLMYIVTTSLSYLVSAINPSAVKRSANDFGVSTSVYAAMTAGDTATVTVDMTGSTKTVNVGGTSANTLFWGSLIE